MYFVAIFFATYITNSCEKHTHTYEVTNIHTVLPVRSYHGNCITDDWLSEGEKLIVDSVSVYNEILNEKMKIESVTFCVDDDAIVTSYQSPFGCEFTIGEAPIGLLSVGLHTLSEIIKVDGGEMYGEFCDTLQEQFRMFADTTQLWTCSVDKKQLRDGDEDIWAVVISVDSAGIYKEVGGSLSRVQVNLGDVSLLLEPSFDYTKICLTNKSLGFISDGNWHIITGMANITDTDGSIRHNPWIIEAEGWLEMSTYPEGSELTVRVYMSCELDEKNMVETYTTTL